jgi:peptide/nickel transport system permease protein
MTTRVGAWLVAGGVLTALAGPALVPFDSSSQELALRLQGPSLAHVLGLDELGRDVAARLVAGARVSLVVAVTVVLVSATFGTAVGAIAGYRGGWLDVLIGRVMDTFMAFPGILLAIALVAVLGPSLVNVVIALTTIGWVGYARLVRGLTLRVRELDYVQAARAAGAGAGLVVWRHVIPATLPTLTVQASLGMAGAILAEASLSFLGLGVQPPTPSWGSMLDAGRSHLIDAPHLTLVPGLAIALVVLGFNFLGDGLRDRLDRRTA